MSDSRTLLALAAVAIGTAVIVSAAVKGAVKGELKAARDQLFEIGPNCETITFKQGVDGDPDPERLEIAERLYFLPFVHQRLSEGAESEAADLNVTLVDLLSVNVLAELFSSFGIIWIAVKAYMADLIARVQAG
jgi:hypothetical protein